MIKNIQLADCFKTGGVRLERVKYFQRQLLTVDDMVTDQEYFRQKMRRHNRFLHGWGIVCGLAVTADPIAGAPLRVSIGEGYALGPFGDEIYVAEPAFLDLGKCGINGKTDPCNPSLATGTGITGGTVYVAIEYAECFSQPVRAMGAGCGCSDDGCEYSRVRDSFDLGCLAAPPVYDPVPLICRLRAANQPAPCPPCPSSPWVVLAAVTLPTTSAGGVTIDPSVRKPLYRTELLQQQLISCCCGAMEKPTTPPPVPVQVQVSGVYPANNATITLNANSPLNVITLHPSPRRWWPRRYRLPASWSPTPASRWTWRWLTLTRITPSPSRRKPPAVPSSPARTKSPREARERRQSPIPIT